MTADSKELSRALHQQMLDELMTALGGKDAPPRPEPVTISANLAHGMIAVLTRCIVTTRADLRFAPSDKAVEAAARIADPRWWGSYDVRDSLQRSEDLEESWVLARDKRLADMRAAIEPLLSANEALARENAEALTVMKQAEGWFLDYAKQHADKQTREGFEKADTNRVRANALRAAINRLEPSHDQ